MGRRIKPGQIGSEHLRKSNPDTLIHGYIISLSQLGQEEHLRLTSVVLDIINSHVGGNKGSFTVFLFVLLLCQQLGLGLFC